MSNTGKVTYHYHRVPVISQYDNSLVPMCHTVPTVISQPCQYQNNRSVYSTTTSKPKSIFQYYVQSPSQ